jgi:ABC-type molybdate transport system substrate-binding protein
MTAARRVWMAAGLAAVGMSAMAQPADTVTVFAAGSLRAALTQIASDFEASPGGAKVRLVFGASGLLRDRLQGGEAADVFASANMEHPQALAAAGRAEPVQRFTRNALCALATPSFSLQGRTLVERLLDPAVKVGTSTPKADPSGDYAFAMFDRVESSGAAGTGAAATLKAKALQLTGGPGSPPPPSDRNVYGAIVAAGQADVFITYCTNAEIARAEQAGLQVLAIPPAINVAADYGLAVLRPAVPAAQRFAAFVLSNAGQARLRAMGFAAP